jgi:hypothetical protein
MLRHGVGGKKETNSSLNTKKKKNQTLIEERADM